MDDKSLDALFSGLTEIAAPPPPNKNPNQKGQPTKTEETPSSKTTSKDGKGKKKNVTVATIKRRNLFSQRGEESFCTSVDTELTKKLRIIASMEGVQIKDVVEAAFRRAIANYESIHGELKDIPKKNLDELFGKPSPKSEEKPVKTKVPQPPK